MKLYELITFAVRVRTPAAALARLQERLNGPEVGGCLIGCWVSEIGPQNQIFVLRGFTDESARQAERERFLLAHDAFAIEAFKAAHGKVDQQALVANPSELGDYDAIIFGTPTRFGNMSGQMRNFLDQTGGLWAKGALVGKIASVFTSTGTGGGQEMTIASTWTTLAHHGMIIVPLGCSTPALFDVSQVGGGTPYRASTIAGGDGSRQPDVRELEIARHQGEYVAKIASKLINA